ncbi:hypothetical protein NC796_21985 [Aliifodinibius sp. S!AR15-10]|uniref:hypothetical protein n=1 Tax=Aliifodinibius sp. S!AR15-10 TaxID=2950437 RepID=UPI00285F6C6E|nr:hypothetical protein [Aliifodinibius sp. S!AR15-10]MDR8393839.1 hypothetical protein [Aliifodinibius sp. S!AR15-10]
MKRKKLKFMDLGGNTLSRREMKSIMAGSGGGDWSFDCEWNGCSTASSYYNCAEAECIERYGSSQQTIDCTNEVGTLWQATIGSCGEDYG